MPSMVDVMVCCYAWGVQSGQITQADQHWEKAQASLALWRDLEDVSVSAITWFELHRGNQAAHADQMTRLRKHVKVYPIDTRVAERAAQLEAAARKSVTICTKCYAPLKSAPPCSVCNNYRSVARWANDIIMVATADVVTEIDTLYTCDGGVVTLGQFVKNVIVREPPTPPPEQIQIAGIGPPTDVRTAAKPRRKKDAK